MAIPKCSVCGDDVSEPFDPLFPGSYRCAKCGHIHGADDTDAMPFDDPECLLYQDDDMLHREEDDSGFITPETDPDHPVVGHRFAAWDGHTYRCDSYDPACGYWMSIDTPNPELAPPDKSRRCVSERAIGRTFHTIHE